MRTAHFSPRQLRRAVVGRLLGAAVGLGAMFFLPAGTVHYWQAWAYLVVLIIAVSVSAIYLLRYNPALLERRLRTREEEPQQKRIIAASTVILLGAFLLPGFDRRFGWSSVPIWLVIFAYAVVLLGYLLGALTLRQNEYASRTVEVNRGQRVIATGPYSIIRHPMYLATILWFGFSPLALGSYWALIPMAAFPAVLVARILNEESVLRRDLDGYADYCRVVRYRLLPGIW